MRLLYVADRGHAQVKVVSLDTSQCVQILQFPPLPTERRVYFSPTDIAVHGDLVFVADSSNGMFVFRQEAGGCVFEKCLHLWEKIWSICVQPNTQNVFYCDPERDMLGVMNLDGRHIATWNWDHAAKVNAPQRQSPHKLLWDDATNQLLVLAPPAKCIFQCAELDY
eukprot:TRINITY_DN523_c0_g1_i1.p1 TRINITY_DN523_c0_g1~~TRINITY_DN523_c0_g1_i1.p1  ORF type:complete len:166 (+),score=22.54 TRINITY_DN523_c0_g1_i1:241-738(+)